MEMMITTVQAVTQQHTDMKLILALKENVIARIHTLMTDQNYAMTAMNYGMFLK